MATNSETSTFEVPKFFSELSLPGSVGFCLRTWLWGRGSRGDTPLHFAAQGAEGIVQPLLEAKAAVDAKNKDGRGLGRGFEGKTS